MAQRVCTLHGVRNAHICAEVQVLICLLHRWGQASLPLQPQDWRVARGEDACSRWPRAPAAYRIVIFVLQSRSIAQELAARLPAGALAGMIASMSSASPALAADFLPPQDANTITIEQQQAPQSLTFQGSAGSAAPAVKDESGLPEGNQWRYSEFISAVQVRVRGAHRQRGVRTCAHGAWRASRGGGGGGRGRWVIPCGMCVWVGGGGGREGWCGGCILSFRTKSTATVMATQRQQNAGNSSGFCALVTDEIGSRRAKSWRDSPLCDPGPTAAAAPPPPPPSYPRHVHAPMHQLRPAPPRAAERQGRARPLLQGR